MLSAEMNHLRVHVCVHLQTLAQLSANANEHGIMFQLCFYLFLQFIFFL